MAISSITLSNLQEAQKMIEGTTLGLMLSLMGGSKGTQQVAPGFFIGPLNLNMLVEHVEVEKYPSIPGIGSYPTSYYVCDTPQQFVERYGKILESAEGRYITFFAHIERTPGEEGGWRWHKWGEYLGDLNPQNEYLDDEGEEFAEGVYVVHVSQVQF